MDQAPAPNSNETPPVQSHPKGKMSRKTLFIIGGVVLLVLAVVAVLFLTKKPTTKPQANDKSSLYVTREGYPYHSGIGDALAIQFKPVAEPVVYQGVKIIQACNVMPLDELRGLGFKTEQLQMSNAFERTYFDGQGKGVVPPEQYHVSEGPESNGCTYQLEDKGAVLTLIVAQEPYVSVDGLTNEATKFTKVSPIGNFNVYEKKEENANQYIIGKGSTAVVVRISRTPADQEKKLIDKIAANLAKEQANPTGPPQVVLESSLIKGGYADACSLLTVDAVKKLFNAEVSPITTQRFGNSVGVSSFDNGVSDNYVSNDCIRPIPLTQADIQTFNTRKVMLETSTFMKADAAKAEMASMKAYNKQRPQVDVTGSGDEAFFLEDNYGEKLFVRKDRFVLQFYFEDKSMKVNQEQKIQILKDIAKGVLDRLK